MDLKESLKENNKSMEIKLVDSEIIRLNEELNGRDICLVYFIEESAELVKELTKYIRHKGKRGNLVEEVADLYYTLSMLVQKYEITEEEINEGIRFKESKAKNNLLEQ